MEEIKCVARGDIVGISERETAANREKMPAREGIGGESL
jgi:hypothetical protein